MSFLKFILKNPFRRKNSAILAIVGIAIGIIVIVSLGGITDGLVNTFEDTIHAGGADFSISGKETGDSAYGTNTIDSGWTEKIANVSGVDEAYPIYVVLTSVGDDSMNTLIGIDAEGSELADISMKEGKLFENNASVGGSLTALIAGYNPPIIPTTIAIENAWMKILGLNSGVIPICGPSKVHAPNPINEPIIADTTVITSDSPTIMVKIFLLDHPTAFKTPISRVLSNTDINIVLIIPKPPTTIAKSEIAQVDAWSIFNISAIWPISITEVTVVMFSPYIASILSATVWINW